MKKISIICIIFLTYCNINIASAQTPPSLPSLESVMQKNEKFIQTNLAREKNKTKQIRKRTISTNATTSLSYQTLIAGDAVRISRYNEVDLWVQEVDLSRGASIGSILTQSGFDENSGEPIFQKKRTSDILTELSSTPFSLINGQFFDPARELTPLSFGLKEGEIIRTAGADNRNESKNILIIGATGASLVPYSWNNLRDASGSLALVSLTLDEAHHRTSIIGRTYICLQNMDATHRSSTLLIFTALAMSESDIENEFPRWGCTRSAVSKLDASGSTRLWIRPNQCNLDNAPDPCSGDYIYGKSRKGDPDYRKIPHYLAVWDKS